MSDVEKYREEYRHGADLCARAAKELLKSDNPNQKRAFEEVMDKALHVMGETAEELRDKRLLKQNEKIRQDLAAYEDSPTPQSLDQLVRDLEKARRST